MNYYDKKKFQAKIHIVMFTIRLITPSGAASNIAIVICQVSTYNILMTLKKLDPGNWSFGFIMKPYS